MLQTKLQQPHPDTRLTLRKFKAISINQCQRFLEILMRSPCQTTMHQVLISNLLILPDRLSTSLRQTTCS